MYSSFVVIVSIGARNKITYCGTCSKIFIATSDLITSILLVSVIAVIRARNKITYCGTCSKIFIVTSDVITSILLVNVITLIGANKTSSFFFPMLTSSSLLRICIEISFVDTSNYIKFIVMSIDMCCVVNYIFIRLTIPVVEHLNGETFMDNSGNISCTGIFIEISYTGFALKSSLLVNVVRLSLC